MEIQITTLNVDDADAIIVHLKRSEAEQLVMMIDGGHAHDSQKCIDALEPVLAKANKKGPELIICTHYDADHIMGLVQVVQYYGNEIKEVWMHRPGGPALLSTAADALIYNERMKMTEQPSGILSAQQLEAKKEQDDLFKLLQNYQQMRTLERTIRDFKITIVDPFPGVKYGVWEEIRVLGPTEDFYKQCVERMKDVPQVIQEEMAELINERRAATILLEDHATAGQPPCTRLEAKRKTPVSMVNQVSVILEIVVNDNKYLFTGDAGLASFEALPGYPDRIRGIHWLKVPHHGSHNNSSVELFEIMNPKFADISGGPRFLNPLVTECLRQREVIVRTTPESGDLVFPAPSNI